MKYLGFIMSMYNLIEYSNNYLKSSGSLWEYYRDNSNDILTNSDSFKSKIKITGNTPNNDNIENVEIAVPLDYLVFLIKILKYIFGELLECC